MKRKIFELALCIGLIILSLFLFIHAGTFPPALQPKVPGPSFFPRIILAALLILCLILVLKNFFSKKDIPDSSFLWHSRSIFIAIGSGILYVFLMPILGFFLVTFLYLIFLLVGRISGWPKILLASFLSVLAMYLMFELLLKSEFPRGLLGI